MYIYVFVRIMILETTFCVFIRYTTTQPQLHRHLKSLKQSEIVLDRAAVDLLPFLKVFGRQQYTHGNLGREQIVRNPPRIVIKDGVEIRANPTRKPVIDHRPNTAQLSDDNNRFDNICITCIL